MKGKAWIREHGLQDALLVDALRQRGMDDVPQWRRFPARDAHMHHWNELAPMRDGPVGLEQIQMPPADMSDEIKRRARALGAFDVGMTSLRPEFVELGVELDYKNVIAVIFHEDYAKSGQGADAVEVEAMNAYARCADISTELARQIREDFGFGALAHHNGATQIQAIPVLNEVGFGELGRHGSLIHKEFGANFRPGFVTTDLPLAYDARVEFGVQDFCMNCNLCRINCPGDAIPDDHIVTDGVKRWLTDIDKCYTISRFREPYCHICVDVCPYIYKENGDGLKRRMFKDYMQARKAKGYKSVNEASPDSVREDGSNQRKYRAAEGVPAATHPAVAALAEAALALLEAGAEGRNSWQRTLQSPGNVTFQLRLTGPDLPASVPPETVHPTDVPKDRAWTGSHRLTVAAPLLAFDIYWTPGAPLRIMTYNRGTWEDALLALT
jgi:epoxyqueuosine reductase